MKQVFLSYARADGKKAQRLYDDLCRLASIRVWFDRFDLLPGVKWKPAIRKAIRESDYFIAVLSRKTVSTPGFRHSEWRDALEMAKELPEGSIFLVPTRLDDCPMPSSELEELNRADLFPQWKEGVARLSRIFGGQADGKRTLTGRRTSATGRPHARLSKSGFHYKVRLADLDRNPITSMIRRVARGLNRVQSIFHLAPERLAAPRQALTMEDGFPHLNIPCLPSTFYERIGPVDMDCAICLTQRLLAFDEEEEVFYNFLAVQSLTNPRVLFVSHAHLDEYARAAGVTLEVAIANRITAELVNFFFDLGYHKEIRNCLMDYTEDHSDLVGVLRAGQFCSYCSEELKTGISRPFAEAFRAMIAWGR